MIGRGFVDASVEGIEALEPRTSYWTIPCGDFCGGSFSGKLSMTRSGTLLMVCENSFEMNCENWFLQNGVFGFHCVYRNCVIEVKYLVYPVWVVKFCRCEHADVKRRARIVLNKMAELWTLNILSVCPYLNFSQWMFPNCYIRPT